MSKRVFPSAIPPFVDAKGDLLVFLAKDGGANAALRMTPSATKLFKLLSTDVPADMLPRSSPSAIAVSAERIAIGFDGGRIDIFDSNYTYKSTLPERHHATVLSLHFLPDGTLLSSGGSSPTGDPESYGKVRTWDLRGEKPTVRDEKDLSGEVHILAFARPRPGEAVKFVIGVHGARRKIQLCTVADGMIEQGHVFVGTDVLEPSGGSMLAPSTAKPPYSAAFSPDGQRVYAGAGNDLVPGTGEIRVWDIKTEEELAKKIGHHTAKISSLAVSQDGTRLVSCAQVDGPKGSSVIEIWDVDLPPERKRSPGE